MPLRRKQTFGEEVKTVTASHVLVLEVVIEVCDMKEERAILEADKLLLGLRTTSESTGRSFRGALRRVGSEEFSTLLSEAVGGSVDTLCL